MKETRIFGYLRMCFPCPTFYQETIRKHCTDGPSTACNEKFVAAITLLLFPDFQGLDLINPKGNLGEEVKLTGILSFKKTIFKAQLKKIKECEWGYKFSMQKNSLWNSYTCHLSGTFMS